MARLVHGSGWLVEEWGFGLTGESDGIGRLVICLGLSMRFNLENFIFIQAGGTALVLTYDASSSTLMELFVGLLDVPRKREGFLLNCCNDRRPLLCNLELLIQIFAVFKELIDFSD